MVKEGEAATLRRKMENVSHKPIALAPSKILIIQFARAYAGELQRLKTDKREAEEKQVDTSAPTYR